MDHRPPTRTQPAASANKLPTIHSNPVMKRSFSSTATVDPDRPTSASTDQAKERNKQALSYNLQMKTALTELLNDARAKGRGQGSRCLQNILMDTERQMRDNRRKSLNTRGEK